MTFLVLAYIQFYYSEFKQFQSGFRAGHTIKTTLVKITSDLLLIGDRGKGAILTLLDLCSAFDSVDHFNQLYQKLDWSQGYCT